MWLDPWELLDGIGDTLQEYGRVAGAPVSVNVLNTLKTVLPLRSGCPQSPSDSLVVDDQVYRDLPRKCWKGVPILHGPYSYRVVITGFVVTNGVYTSPLEWDVVTVWFNEEGIWSDDVFRFLVELSPDGSYPDGAGMTLIGYAAAGFDHLPILTWVLPEGSQQNNWNVSTLPTVRDGWTIITYGTARIEFVSVSEHWPVNPEDVFHS